MSTSIRKLAGWMGWEKLPEDRDAYLYFYSPKDGTVRTLMLNPPERYAQGRFYAARWNPEKNIAHAFMLLDRVEEKYPNVEYELQRSFLGEYTFAYYPAQYGKEPMGGGSAGTRPKAICNAIEKLIDETTDAP